jgi:hypothetical protein
MNRTSTSVSTAWAPVRALARVEGEKLLRSPLFLAGAAFVTIGSAIFVRASLTNPSATWNDDGWTVAAGTIFLAILTMVATNHAALRDRREDTDEQHASLPIGRPTRIGGLLVATAWPAALVTVMLISITAYAATRGPVTAMDNVHLVEGPVVILTMGALGLALATWIPSSFVAPVVAWGLFLIAPGDGAAAWHALTPFASASDVGLALWHLGYVAGLAVLLGVVALSRASQVRWVVAAGAVGLAVVIVPAAVLLMRACPGDGPCLL